MTLFLLVCLTIAAAEPTDAAPQVSDPALQLQLVAESPDIVTPTGLAVDPQGRVLVIESHTHFPPEGYQGPTTDRILRMEDTTGDGRADRITPFFSGSRHTMNLAIHPNGFVYVATRAKIFRLRDTTGNGQADEQTELVKLITDGNYPHNGLSGFAFDLAGDVYFGLGENLGASYRLEGSDGTALAGGGEGGNIYRCRADGSRLERIATGFWNPFHLALDELGHLLAVDNDPDSRPPCRLIDVVPGGDYGYRFRNGRKGTHPFTAWNGELPGTLPMVAGTGEAPSGLLAYASDGLPDTYRGAFLSTSWGDHRIERYRLQPRGASFVSTMEPVVVGGENFRPVGIAQAPDGSIYFSDWVDRSYKLHGKGRVWRLSSRQTAKSPARPKDDQAALACLDLPWRVAAAQRLVKTPAGRDLLRRQIAADNAPELRHLVVELLARHQPDDAELASKALADSSPAVQVAAITYLNLEHLPLAQLLAADQPAPVRAAALRRAPVGEHLDALLLALGDDDPFIRQAAAYSLEQQGGLPAAVVVARLPQGQQRAAAAVVQRATGVKPAEAIPALLADADPRVRFVGVQWIGEEQLTPFRQQLTRLLGAENTTRDLFEATLAALARLDGNDLAGRDERTGSQYIAAVLLDGDPSAAVRRQALRRLPADHPRLTLERLEQFLLDDDSGVRLEAVRTLAMSPHEARHARLEQIAADAQLPTEQRGAALLGLDPTRESARRLLLQLAAGSNHALAEESLRSLRGVPLTASQRATLAAPSKPDADASPAGRAHQTHRRQLLARLESPAAAASSPLPADRDAWVDQWLAQLSTPGDPAAGERIFFHPQGPGCFRCHELSGRGGVIGPELSELAGRLTRRRLIESIIDPDREVAPHFIPWTIITTDGRSHVGLLLQEELDGTQIYADPQGGQFRLRPTDVEQRQPSPHSLMPRGLERQMTPTEFRDLLSCLLEPRATTP